MELNNFIALSSFIRQAKLLCQAWRTSDTNRKRNLLSVKLAINDGMITKFFSFYGNIKSIFASKAAWIIHKSAFWKLSLFHRLQQSTKFCDSTESNDNDSNSWSNKKKTLLCSLEQVCELNVDRKLFSVLFCVGSKGHKYASDFN